MMMKDNINNQKRKEIGITLLSLMAENSGRFDVCALIFDVCTNCDSFDKLEYEPIIKRMLDVKKISKQSYIDLKRIINYIQSNFVFKVRDEENKNNLITIDNDGKVLYISPNFDDVFIKRIIEKYYQDLI